MDVSNSKAGFSAMRLLMCVLTPATMRMAAISSLVPLDRQRYPEEPSIAGGIIVTMPTKMDYKNPRLIGLER